MWNRKAKEDDREVVLSAGAGGDSEVSKMLAKAGPQTQPASETEDGPYDTLIAALDAEIPDLITGKRKKDVEQEDDLDDEEEEEDDLDEEEDEDDFDDEEDEDEFEEEFGDDDLDDDDDDIFYDDDDDE